MMDFPVRDDSGRSRSETLASALGQNTHRHQRTPSFGPSVHSWILSTQQNPPLPPPDTPEHVTSPLRALRPLPEQPRTTFVQSQGPLSHPPLQVTNPTETDDEYCYVDANGPGMASGYLTEGLGRGQRFPRYATQQSASLTPRIANESQGRSFVGGFVRGLKKLPKRVLRYRNSSEKRHPTSATEGGESTEAVTTLPRYRSNPSTPIAGPSTVMYVQATEMPVPQVLRERLPADALRSVRPRHPSYRVMPLSANGVAEEQSAQVYNMPPADPPSFLDSTRQSTPPLEADRATTLIYDNPADATSTNGQPQSQSLRISYISHHTPNTRAPTLNQATPQHVPSQVASEPQDNLTSVHTPVLAHPPLSTDYRKMSLNSHDTTSHSTASTSYSLEPSFSSELSPVKRFFHVLQSLPWVATERLTSDYHPGGGSDKDLPKKKPMISWYRRSEDVAHQSGIAATVDLLSPGSPGSRVARLPSNSVTVTSLSSPVLHTSRVRKSHSHMQPQRHHHVRTHHQRHHHHHHRHSHGGHHRRRRRTMTSTVTGPDDDTVPNMRNVSPMIPPVYPLQFPYAYHYATPPSTSPRGPRSRRSPSYPGGYVPFQPMPPSPPPMQMPTPSPVYVLATNARSQGSGFGDGLAIHGQMQHPSVVKQVLPMYVVPGAFPPNGPTTAMSPASSPVMNQAAQNAP
ncbi:hypothetical protein AX17_001920 [Amanita inopinata Kibby_2008]|nr:hypothetical protein AX17_001920 [Amanita inopinata Kibby_2008]